MIPYNYFAILSVILFAIAIYGILAKRNGITLVISAEIIINAALINFVGASEVFNSYDGASYALIILIMAVIETVVFIAMLIILSKKTGSVSLSKLRKFRG
jgi:NADH:ubiquinone oxidoreductase subunit K